MRSVIVLSQKISQASGQFGFIVPGVRQEPFFERAHETLGNPVGLRTVASDQDMDKLFFAYQLSKGTRGEMGTAVGNHKMEFRRQQAAQSFGNHLGGDMRACAKEWQAQALAGAVVGDDEDGNPCCHQRQSHNLLAQAQALLTPSLVFLLPMRYRLPPLRAERQPGGFFA